jgi:hypothetical protein
MYPWSLFKEASNMALTWGNTSFANYYSKKGKEEGRKEGFKEGRKQI